jgi:hypothetical protein
VYGSDGNKNYFWDSPKYWYFFEKDYGYKLTDVVNHGQNLAVILREPNTIFLVCAGRGNQELCLEEFAYYFSPYSLVGEKTVDLDQHYGVYTFVKEISYE